MVNVSVMVTFTYIEFVKNICCPQNPFMFSSDETFFWDYKKEKLRVSQIQDESWFFMTVLGNS